MSVDAIMMIVMPIIFVAMAIVMIMGKGDWMINTPRRREGYNILRLRIVTALMLVFMAVMFPLIYFIGHDTLFGGIILAGSLIGVVIMETWARR